MPSLRLQALPSLLLDLLFPPACAACDHRTRARTPLCLPCAESLYPIEAACRRCALPLDGPRSTTCARCLRRPPPLDRADAGYRFGAQLAVALRQLKFQRRPDIARTLAPLVAPPLAGAIAAAGAELIVPVPLHWRRLARRGYNQSALLVRRAAALLPDAPAVAPVLRRVRATPPQTGRDARARRRNVAGAFAVAPRADLRGRRVLLVDDVMTTGATLFEAGLALRAAGAASVAAFAVARADAQPGGAW